MHLPFGFDLGCADMRLAFGALTLRLLVEVTSRKAEFA
jgi:hypothetical protein